MRDTCYAASLLHARAVERDVRRGARRPCARSELHEHVRFVASFLWMRSLITRNTRARRAYVTTRRTRRDAKHRVGRCDALSRYETVFTA